MTRHTVTITNPERTFIVADIHGQDALLEKALGEVGFSAANGDVLYGLGDLIDRGPQNTDVLYRFTQPGYHTTLGNHEAIFLALLDNLSPEDAIDIATFIHEGGMALIIEFVNDEKARVKYRSHLPEVLQANMLMVSWLYNGGAWFFVDANRRPAIQWEAIEYAKQIDFHQAIELDTPLGKLGLVHAAVPDGDWSGTDRLAVDVDAYHLWDKHAAKLAFDDTSPAPTYVANIDRVVVGHCITPTHRPLLSGNTVYMDTGAAKGLSPRVMSVSDIFSL